MRLRARRALLGIACVMSAAALARAEDVSAPVVPVLPQAGPSAAPAAIPQALSAPASLPVAPGLAAQALAAPAISAAPQARTRQGAAAIEQLKDGAAAVKPDAAAPEASPRQRFDGSAQTPVAHDAEARLFSMDVGGQKAFLQYRLRQDRLIILHTEVPRALEGRGVGGKIVKTALDYAREKGLRVNPLCPFAAAYIQRHKDYQDLVAR